MSAGDHLSPAEFGPRSAESWDEFVSNAHALGDSWEDVETEVPLYKFVLAPEAPAFPDIAEQYAALETPFPPVSGVEQPSGVFVTDGNHRVSAAGLRGETAIRARIRRKKVG